MSDQEFKAIVDYIRSNKSSIVNSSSFDLGKLSEKKKRLVYRIAGSCIFNGPVGVGKRSVWIDEEGEKQETSIRELLGCTGFMWRNFCRTIAENFDHADCHCNSVWGNVWPLCENEEGQMPKPKTNFRL